MKKKHIEEELDLFQEESDFINFQKSFNKRKTITFAALFAVCVIFSVVLFTNEGLNKVTLGEEGKIELTSMPIASTVVKKGVISIPSGMVKSNPFLPYRNLGEYTSIDDLPNLELIEPPESINPSSDAARVMDTIVSGILYDKYSPSAILNIEGNDYLVKKGDVVNNYKVLSILEDSVTVKLGENVYKAGIGEILTEGTLTHNNISNLNNKFGGVQ